MKTKYNFVVQFCDVDTTKHLRLSDLVKVLIEASDDSVTINGIGPVYLKDNYNAGWVLMRMCLQMEQLPSYKDNLCIETWMESESHGIVTRHCIIYLKQGNEEHPIGYATTFWTIIDLHTRVMCKSVFKDDSFWKSKTDEGNVSSPRLTHSCNTEQPPCELQYVITYSDLDMNGHLNSCKYIAIMMDACDALTSLSPICFDIKYSHEIYPEENVIVRAYRWEDKIRYQIVNQNGETACSAVIQKH